MRRTDPDLVVTTFCGSSPSVSRFIRSACRCSCAVSSRIRAVCVLDVTSCWCGLFISDDDRDDCSADQNRRKTGEKDYCLTFSSRCLISLKAALTTAESILISDNTLCSTQKSSSRHSALCPTGCYWGPGEICLRRQRIICEPLDQRSREFTDALHQVWGIAKPFDLAYDRAADDGGIGKPPDLPYLFRS
jgi:hypothetical protein